MQSGSVAAVLWQSLVTGSLVVLAALVTGFFSWHAALRSLKSQESAKRSEAEGGRLGAFVGLAEHIVDERSKRVLDLETRMDAMSTSFEARMTAMAEAHADDMAAVHQELRDYKDQCSQLTAKVNNQTLIIEKLRADNTSLRNSLKQHDAAVVEFMTEKKETQL